MWRSTRKGCQLVAGIFQEFPQNSGNFPAFSPEPSRKFPQPSQKFPQPSCIFPATFSKVSAILPGSRNAFYSHNNQFLSIVSDENKNTNKTLKKLNCVCCSTSDDAKNRLTQSETYLKMKREVYYVLMIQTQWAQERPIIVLLFRTLGRPLWTPADVYFGLGKDLLVRVFW